MQRMAETEMKKIESENFHKFIKYYDSERDLRLLIISSLMTGQGELWTDDIDYPEICIFNTQFFSAIYGSPNHDFVNYVLELIPIHKYILAPKEWKKIIHNKYKRKLIIKKDSRYWFNSKKLSVEYLKQLRELYFNKYDYSTYNFEMLSTQDCLSNYLKDNFLSIYRDEKEILDHGFAVVAKDEHGKIRSIAGVAHPPYNMEYEVQIVTEPEFRGKGLGMIISIDLLIYSILNGYDPHWDAATSISADIAEKLGYMDKTPYDITVRSITPIIILRATKIPLVIIWILRKFGKLKY